MAITYEYDSSGMSKVVDMTNIRNLEDEDLEGTFYIHITNGYIVRSLIHMLRDVVLYAILELTPDRLQILRYDKTGRLIIDLVLKTSHFTSYFFLSKKPSIKIGLDFSHLWHKMKILGKPDPFIAYKEDGKEHIILDFGSMATHQYTLRGVVEQNISLPQYNESNLGINISVRELSKAMTALRTNKSKITFKGYKDYLIIETPKKQTFQRLGTAYNEFWRPLGLKPEDITAMADEDDLYCSLKLPLEDHGETTSDDEPLVVVEQTHTLLKSLAKVCNISDNSPIRVITEAGKPIKLTISVYQYGYLSFYLFKEANPTSSV